MKDKVKSQDRAPTPFKRNLKSYLSVVAVQEELEKHPSPDVMPDRIPGVVGALKKVPEELLE